MKSNLKKLACICMMLCSSHIVFGQFNEKDTENMIGTPMPDYSFEKVRSVSDVRYPHIPKVQKMSLMDFQGKWTLAYFWTRNCIPCINHFPELNEYQNSFQKDLNVLLVGINDSWNANMKDFFDGVRMVQKLNSVSYTFDSVLVNKMNIKYSGTALLIDPKGVLRRVFVGDISNLNKKKLQNLITRKE